MKKINEKIKKVFGDYAIDKGLINRLGVSGDDRQIPSYVLDWIVTSCSKKNNGTTNLQSAITTFIKNHLPAKSEKEVIKHKLLNGEIITILDAISVKTNLNNAEMPYEAEIKSLDEKKVYIEKSLIDKHHGLLIGGMWGATKIMHDTDNKGIKIIDFKPMQAGRVSLDILEECRKEFTVEEWIDLIISTMGYEPSLYGESEKLWMLCRLIPVVNNRINMMELAPPGSGKSYIYNNISRHVWLTAAPISPAVLFYNQTTKRPGLLTRYDLLVLDEAQSIKFKDAGEIQAQLKGYLEQGVYTRGDLMATAECGIMLLANIGLKKASHKKYSNGSPMFLPSRKDYIRKLPEVLLESPLIDRFHGIIPGWEIPPFNTEQAAQGFGLKADFFAEVCHSLRDATSISQKIRSKLALLGYKRDCTAIERLSAALAKILLIDTEHPRFEELILSRAIKMRTLVREQLHQLDEHGYAPKLDIKNLSIINSKNNTIEFIEKIENYGLLEEVGKGGMAKVFKAIDLVSKETVALKISVDPDSMVSQKSIQREIDIYERLKYVDSPHLIKVHDVFRYKNSYSIVMEYADEGTLWDLLGGDAISDNSTRHILDEKNVKEIILEILNGLSALHKNAIVHRDLKPHNILRCDNIWKIADFGISKRTNKPVTGFTFQGAYTTPWASPEQMRGDEAHASTDIYSVGQIIWFLLTGKEKKTKSASLPKHWQSIVDNCLNDNPESRPCLDDLITKIEQLDF